MKIPSTSRASWDLLVCNLAFPEFTLPEKARMAAAPPMPILPVLAVCTASALPIMGQRRAMVCRLDIAPPPGEAWLRAVLVESDRRVAGDVFCKKGHRDLD